MNIKVEITFKNGTREIVTFEAAGPKDKEEKPELRTKAFDKIVRMVMTMGRNAGFINTNGFGFRVEDVTSLKLLPED